MAAGVVTVLLLMPFVFAAQYLAVRALGPFDEEFRHPVEKMLRKEFSSEVAVLAVLSAVVLAPLFEEMMFRGIFQTWLVDLLDRFGKMLWSGLVRVRDPNESVSFPIESGHLPPSPELVDGLEPAVWAEDFADEEPDRHPAIDEWSAAHWEVGDPVPAVSKP